MELDRASLADAPRIGGLAMVRSGDEVLERLGLGSDSASQCAARLGGVLAVELAVAFASYAATRPRFLKIKPGPQACDGKF